jgi:hypothetical protein
MPVLRPEILLDKYCRIGSCQNSTSAKTKNREGLSVEVSFEIRDPPALSLCFARCYDAAGRQRCAQQLTNILCAAGGLALLSVPFSDGGDVDFFVYRAGPGVPSLHLLPGPYPTTFQPSNFAVLPICNDDDDDSQHFAVVLPDIQLFPFESPERIRYTMHVYRSDDSKAWRATQVVPAEGMETLDAILDPLMEATSAVYAGSGLIGWIDLWRGILLCNVLDEKPTVRFVALPVPQPGETPTDLEYEADFNPRRHRHVTVYNGVMKFVDLKFHAEAAFNVKRRDDQGWMATVWTRLITSDVWHEGVTFDTSDISVPNDSGFLHLLPEILVDEKELTWKNFSSGTLTLSLRDDNTVYILVVKMNSYPATTLLLTVNTGSLTLESCAQCFGEMLQFFQPSYVPSDLSSYFDETISVLS